MNKINIELDLDEIKEGLVKYAVESLVRRHFEAEDVEWSKRNEVKQKRLNNVINKVDWNKLPEEMQRGVISEFMKKFIK